MDKGAHFYKCDFQVHTPRDNNWSGGDATSTAERKAYAEELIRACREKGLGAIAITDHHDLAFFPYVRKAAQEELDDSGRPIPDEARLVVFPGIELTLESPPCQALLILDAAFPDSLLQSVLTALSITTTPPDEAKHAPVQRIAQSVANGLTELYQRLNSHDHLKGRFIVLPNVSETGYGTLLRSGFAGYYKTMPCVGGYVDGCVSQFGAGNLAITGGENRDYGFKAIAVFQTSDNRKRNHEDLGKHATWVKWSESTAEALRQACLAKESRLSQDEPELPAVWVTSVSVSNSKFLGRVELDLNQQNNAIIGGRGTGKSTILEYLRWGLCDQPVESYDSELAPVQTKRKKLIEDTLQKFDGEVHVTFSRNRIRHIVKRSSKRPDILLKIGDGEFVQTTEQEVRNLLPVQAYSQKQLSSVGVRIEELKRFVELPIKKALDQLRSDIRDTEAKIRAAYGNVVRKKEIEVEVNRYSVEVTSLSTQLQGLRAGLKGLSLADQAVIDQKAKYDREQAIVDDLKNELANAKAQIGSLEVAFGGGEGREEPEPTELQNAALIRELRTQFAARMAEVRKAVAVLAGLVGQASLKSLNDQFQKWEALKQEFEKRYEAAKANAKVNQQELEQIGQLEKRIGEVNRLQLEKRNALTALSDPETTYKELRHKWDGHHLAKLAALTDECAQFTALSKGLIKAEMAKSLDTNRLVQRVKTAFAGMNIREAKIEELCQSVAGASAPLTAWNGVLGELEALALHRADGSEPLPATAALVGCGFNEKERTRIAASLGSERWLDLSVAELEFNPNFLYCTNQETSEFIEFGDASAGQQATALLTVLLNQEGPPLIIDQPEDDVDSKMVKDIVEQIWKAKSKRQLIFASHNANFVVNGDAELVACCDYVKAGDQTGGRIKAMGAIDKEEIREEITTVTEGGRQAFKLRMVKYGF